MVQLPAGKPRRAEPKAGESGPERWPKTELLGLVSRRSRGYFKGPLRQLEVQPYGLPVHRDIARQP